MDLLNDSSTPLVPQDYLSRCGRLIDRFDERTQDSGNVSWSVDTGDSRYFVKSAGEPGSEAFLGWKDRVYWLRNAARLAARFPHSLLPRLFNQVESPHGPLLVYEWVPGELVGVPSAERSNPDSSQVRFKSLPLPRLVAALGQVFLFHVELCDAGWVANDFYDRSMIYDFKSHQLRLIDLDLYREAPFTNNMGRMFGSSRFMAPEEFEKGQLIDERTTIFTMGRCIQVFMTERGDCDPLLQVADRACRVSREERISSMTGRPPSLRCVSLQSTGPITCRRRSRSRYRCTWRGSSGSTPVRPVTQCDG